MRVDVMHHYGFTQPLSHAGYYETAHHRQLMSDIKSASWKKVIALCGVIGVEDRHPTLYTSSQGGNRVRVAKSMAVEKDRITLAHDDPSSTMPREKPFHIPTKARNASGSCGNCEKRQGRGPLSMKR